MSQNRSSAVIAKPPKITSSYAILDVEKGRKALAKYLERHGPVPVVIEAVVTCPYGRDDGISLEFIVDVVSVKVVS